MLALNQLKHIKIAYLIRLNADQEKTKQQHKVGVSNPSEPLKSIQFYKNVYNIHKLKAEIQMKYTNKKKILLRQPT